MRDRRTALVSQHAILVAFVAAPKGSGDTADIDAVMFKKRTVLGNRDSLDQMLRPIFKRNCLAASIAFGGDRAQDTRFQLCILKPRLQRAIP